MPFGVNLWEILVVLFVALLIFGPKRMPEMGRSLGRGIREFKDSLSNKAEPDDEPTQLPPPHEENAVGASPSRPDAR